ncbi:hypothetical protein FQZ97_1053400 [compost metagenome]
MADMHRPGRIGRDIFDIDALLVAVAGAAIFGAARQKVGQMLLPERILELEVDEAWACNLGLDHVGVLGELGDQPLSQRARVLPGRFRQHHRRVGREIAMGGVARRLDGDAGEVECTAIFWSQFKRFDGFGNPLAEIGENVHVLGSGWHCMATGKMCRKLRSA